MSSFVLSIAVASRYRHIVRPISASAIPLGGVKAGGCVNFTAGRYLAFEGELLTGRSLRKTSALIALESSSCDLTGNGTMMTFKSATPTSIALRTGLTVIGFLPQLAS